MGELVEGDRAPSSDTAAHAYVYRHMEHIGGVVHTHSRYATAWAAIGEPIPCVLTMIADEFGGEIPLGPFALIGDDSIGRGIVDTLTGHRSRAVLMRSHGPFTIGRDAEDAVKAAVMVEDVARTVFLARELGTPARIAQNRYRRTVRPLSERVRPGLTAGGPLHHSAIFSARHSGSPIAGKKTIAMSAPSAPLECWFLTGSQALYGPETLEQVAEQSQTIASTLGSAKEVAISGGVEAGPEGSRCHPADDVGGQR